MSKHETPMIRAFWNQIGGTLIEEFCAVRRSQHCGQRLLDGVILPNGEKRIVRSGEFSVNEIEGEDIIVVQAKASRLGMYLMGQTLFSAELLKPFKPKSILSVALVLQDDLILRPLLESHPNMKVVILDKSALVCVVK